MYNPQTPEQKGVVVDIGMKGVGRVGRVGRKSERNEEAISARNPVHDPSTLNLGVTVLWHTKVVQNFWHQQKEPKREMV